MSLINDALKKVQRLHGHHESVAPLPSAPGSPPVHSSSSPYAQRRGTPPTGQMVVLIGAGAAVLIVFSVIITVVLLNRKPEPAHPLTTISAVKPAVDLNASSPVIVAPVIAPPASVTEKLPPATGPDYIAAAPATTVAAEAPAPPPPVPVLVVAPPSNERIYTFIDAIRVTGINSSGNSSKVIMNDRIYRVNDIVERQLGLKLVKVEADVLTFADEHGTIYTKNF